MLADIEYSTLKSYSLNRLLHNDGFDQPDAYIGNINYTSEHNLNRFFDRAACNLRIYHQNAGISLLPELPGLERSIWSVRSG